MIVVELKRFRRYIRNEPVTLTESKSKRGVEISKWCGVLYVTFYTLVNMFSKQSVRH